MRTIDFLSGKKFTIALASFFWVSSVPFLILSFYCNPTPEDFAWSEPVRSWGFFEAQKFFYKVWSGRFFSYILLSVNPLLFKSIFGYKFLLFVTIILFAFVLYFFISTMTGKKLDTAEKSLLTGSVFFLYIYSMPAISEGLFWMTSVMIYNAGLMLSVMIISLYVRMVRSGKKIFYASLISVLLVCLAGTTEIAGIFILMLVMSVLIVKSISEKKVDRLLLLFTIILLTAIAFSFSSPGNSYRGDQMQNNHDFLFSISKAVSFSGINYSAWILNSPLLTVSVLVIPLILKCKIFSETPQRFTIKPFYSIVSFLIIPVILIFFFVWNTGVDPYSRVKNISFFIFLLLWFFNLAVCSNYLIRKPFLSSVLFSRYFKVIMIVTMLLLMAKKNNVRSASSEIWYGTASACNSEFEKRYEIISNCDSDPCVVPPIEKIPRSLFLIDITRDPQNLYNQWYSQYFGKRSIILK